MYALVFGTPEQASAAATSVVRRHDSVVGPGYRAQDPELLLWVYATLVDSALLLYERFVRPLPADLEASYHLDAACMGAALGIPPALIPSSPEAFRAYFEATIANLEVGAVARELASEVLAPHPRAAAPAFLLLRGLTAGLLPPRLRAQYGLGWGPRREQALESAASVSRVLWPQLPLALRRPPWFLMPPGAPAAGARAG
jgi:uncharacterized protein (DUF2236 family)